MMKRFFEPSTWAGLAGLLQAVQMLAPPQYHAILAGASALAAAVAVKMPEAAK